MRLLNKNEFSSKYSQLDSELLELAYAHYLENDGEFNLEDFLKQFQE